MRTSIALVAVVVVATGFCTPLPLPADQSLPVDADVAPASADGGALAATIDADAPPCPAAPTPPPEVFPLSAGCPAPYDCECWTPEAHAEVGAELDGLDHWIDRCESTLDDVRAERDKLRALAADAAEAHAATRDALVEAREALALAPTSTSSLGTWIALLAGGVLVGIATERWALDGGG